MKTTVGHLSFLTASTAVTALLAMVPATAHHSFAMFDMAKNLTLEGTIREVQWTNPHVWIQLVVKDAASDKEQEWSIEADSPNVLTRRGWTRKSLKAGDKAVVGIHPLKSEAMAGISGGTLMSVSVNGVSIGGAPRAPGEAREPQGVKP